MAKISFGQQQKETKIWELARLIILGSQLAFMRLQLQVRDYTA